MSDTPRCNAFFHGDIPPWKAVEFARTLERELAEAGIKVKEWRDNSCVQQAAHEATVELLAASREYARALKYALDDLLDRCHTEVESYTPCLTETMERARAALAKNPNGAKTVTPSCAEGQGASEASTGSSPTYCASCGGLMAESGCCNACGRAALAVGRLNGDRSE